MFKLLWKILKDDKGTTLAVTYSFSPNTLIASTQMNTNFDDIEAVVNALTSANFANDSVGAAALNSDVVRSGYGLIQHTDGSLYVDVSDTNPCLEITDGGLRAKVDDSSIERASGGLQVKALGITNAMLAGSIGQDKLAGSIPDSLLNTITTANKVSGSAVQLKSGGGISDSSGLTLSIYDSGWFAVAVNTTYTKAHGLGSATLLPMLFFSSSSDGSGHVVPSMGMSTPNSGLNNNAQLAIVDIDATNIKVRTRAGIIDYVDGDGTDQGMVTSGYARIIAVKLA